MFGDLIVKKLHKLDKEERPMRTKEFKTGKFSTSETEYDLYKHRLFNLCYEIIFHSKGIKVGVYDLRYSEKIKIYDIRETGEQNELVDLVNSFVSYVKNLKYFPDSQKVEYENYKYVKRFCYHILYSFYKKFSDSDCDFSNPVKYFNFRTEQQYEPAEHFLPDEKNKMLNMMLHLSKKFLDSTKSIDIEDKQQFYEWLLSRENCIKWFEDQSLSHYSNSNKIPELNSEEYNFTKPRRETVAGVSRKKRNKGKIRSKRKKHKY